MEESATSIVDLSNEKEPEIVNLEEEINLLDREAAEKDFQAKEAALEAYLEALKPKPPRIRKSIADLLKNDPGFAKIADLKPTINPGPKGFIEFSSPKTKRSKSHRNIQNLIDRFRKHTSVVKKPKEKHFTVVVTNKEEDSQGNEKSIVDKVDYVQHLDDEDEILDTTISPLRQTAGAKFCQFLEKLQIDMRAKKTKEYEEKMKNHSLYEDEKFEKNPEEEEEEEVLEDDFSTESEPELTDEEAEAIRSALRKKKKRKVKSAFVEDEAEVSDSTNQGSDDEDESTSETEIDLTQKLKSYKRVQLLEDSSDESDVEIITLDEEEPTEVTSTLLNSSEIEMIVPKEDPDLLSLPESQTFLEHAQRFTSQSDTLFLPLIECPSSQLDELNPAQVSIMMSPQPGSNSETQEILTDASQITSSHREIMKLIETPLILPFSSETQLDVFSPTISSQCSAMMPRFDSEAALDAFKEDMPFPTMSQPLSKEISKLVSNSEKNSPDLLVLCSGIFPSQNPPTPEDSPCMFPDSPTEDETGIIKNTLKDQFLDSPAEGETRIVTRTLKDQDTTPKVLEKEKLNKTRLFTRMESFNFESESDDDNNEQEGIGRIVKKRKQHRRLKFSDDEDEEEEKPIQEKEEEEELKIIESDVEQGYDSEENEIIIPKASFKGFVSKEGKLRRQFVENEAELSGSEDGSADEDERGLDEMEEEEGDTEEIDDEVLREQIGKAHIRNLIDDDDRQIRLLQDVLLEDGDLHGEGNIREKQFKWKHIDLLDEFGDRKLEEGLEVEPDEDAAERLWKEQKAEKVKWMKENSHLSQKNEIDSEEEDSQKIFLENSKYFKLGKSTLRKIRSSCSMTESSSLSGNSCSESMMLSENTTGTGEMNLRKIGIHSQLLFASPENPILKIKHGSFLARGKCLARLAEMTKGADESSSTVNNNSRNFVFSVITPPGPEAVSGKRKKSFTRHPTNQNQPRKMPRIDRSFESLDAATKAASIFSQY